MTKTKAAPTADPSTEELLLALDAKRAASEAESPPADVGAVTLAAGTRKVCIFRPSQVEECRNRSRAAPGAKPVPTWLVYELSADAVLQVIPAFSFRGAEVEPLLNLRGGRPFGHLIPNRVPGTSGVGSGDYVPDADVYLYTVGELTVFTEPRPVVVEATVPAKPVEEFPPLPSIPMPEFGSAELSTAVHLVARIVKESPPNLRRSGIATKAAEVLGKLAMGLYAGYALRADGQLSMSDKHTIAALPESAVFTTPGLSESMNLILRTIRGNGAGLLLHAAAVAVELIPLLHIIDEARREAALQQLNQQQQANDRKQLDKLMA